VEKCPSEVWSFVSPFSCYIEANISGYVLVFIISYVVIFLQAALQKNMLRSREIIPLWMSKNGTWFNFFFLESLPLLLHFITTSHHFKCVFLKWLIPLDVAAWRLNLFLYALLLVALESVSNNFGFIWFEKGEIFWKETSKRLKDQNNTAIKRS